MTTATTPQNAELAAFLDWAREHHQIRIVEWDRAYGWVPAPQWRVDPAVTRFHGWQGSHDVVAFRRFLWAQHRVWLWAEDWRLRAWWRQWQEATR